MAPDALTPNDPRVKHEFIPIPGTDITYHCLVATPPSKNLRATILLIHGFPDIAMGWRYQVPYLLSLNLRVVVPDMLGYGRTSAPEAREVYTYKNMCTHMAHIVKTIAPNQKVLLGGHDWGGYTAWRLAMWYPELFLSVFSFAVHYTPPTRQLVTVDDLLKVLPSLAYQKQLIAPDLEHALGKDPAKIRHFLDALYNGQPSTEHNVAAVNQGLDIPHLDTYGATPLMTAVMMDHFVAEYARNGLKGPFNWYRVRDLNHQDELVFLQPGQGKYTFKIPAMLVMADQDLAFPPGVADKQQRFFEKGLKQHLIKDCSHWIMIERPEEANKLIGEFVAMVLGEEKSDRSKL
ncbi:Alpha/Beta hydrolase protein [Microdochium bolleyi]|uniref:Alpha/Beta hydrolase protein n=1 Tax=Microdochium bolleyi TaxID=196109 RepID=A0A136J2Y1_9PEZI|nr:Alpha/Beta hydrolase protein [Microdochium bolleyi]